MCGRESQKTDSDFCSRKQKIGTALTVRHGGKSRLTGWEDEHHSGYSELEFSMGQQSVLEKKLDHAGLSLSKEI